jgi:signal transduction histidine kinase
VAKSGAGRAAGAPSAEASVERLWLATLQRLSGGVAHEIRNALNAVAVNLEVVRSRSGRDGLLASSLGQYATSASDQLEGVITVAEALIALNRAPQRPLAAGRIADQLLALIRPPLVANGGGARLVVEGEGASGVPADVARLVLAGALEAGAAAAFKHRMELLCVVRPVDGIEVEITTGAVPLSIDDDVRRLGVDNGITVRVDHGIVLKFPK